MMTIARTMTAWTQDRYGGPEVVAPTERPVPTPGPRDVLIRVEATGLNSADIRIMRGEPLLLRLAFGLRRPRTETPGRDVAGTIVAVGAEVTDRAIGDVVAGEISGGGLADVTVAAAGRVVPVPAGVNPVTAAALPLAGGTAWQALDAAGPADRILVIGAGGGVGTLAVRLAVLRGMSVDALCGAAAVEVVTALGATGVHDYRRTDIAGLGVYDAIIDIAGTTPLRILLAHVREGGTIVGVAGGANRVTGPLGRMLAGAVRGIGARRRIRPLAASTRPELTAQLLDLAAAGTLAPHIERTWPRDRTGEALAHVDAGHTVGKIVVTAR